MSKNKIQKHPQKAYFNPANHDNIHNYVSSNSSMSEQLARYLVRNDLDATEYTFLSGKVAYWNGELRVNDSEYSAETAPDYRNSHWSSMATSLLEEFTEMAMTANYIFVINIRIDDSFLRDEVFNKAKEKISRCARRLKKLGSHVVINRQMTYNELEKESDYSWTSSTLFGDRKYLYRSHENGILTSIRITFGKSRFRGLVVTSIDDREHSGDPELIILHGDDVLPEVYVDLLALTHSGYLGNVSCGARLTFGPFFIDMGRHFDFHKFKDTPPLRAWVKLHLKYMSYAILNPFNHCNMEQVNTYMMYFELFSSDKISPKENIDFNTLTANVFNK